MELEELLTAMDRAAANVTKLEVIWDRASGFIPTSPAAGSPLEYDDFCRAWVDLLPAYRKSTVGLSPSRCQTSTRGSIAAQRCLRSVRLGGSGTASIFPACSRPWSSMLTSVLAIGRPGDVAQRGVEVAGMLGEQRIGIVRELQRVEHRAAGAIPRLAGQQLRARVSPPGGGEREETDPVPLFLTGRPGPAAWPADALPVDPPGVTGGARRGWGALLAATGSAVALCPVYGDGTAQVPAVGEWAGTTTTGMP
jgi:hypothetical protein